MKILNLKQSPSERETLRCKLYESLLETRTQYHNTINLDQRKYISGKEMESWSSFVVDRYDQIQANEGDNQNEGFDKHFLITEKDEYLIKQAYERQSVCIIYYIL